MRKFTEKQLARYDGKNGRPSYVAYKGKVFDVSNSFLWKDGVHQAIHKAGMDLTSLLKDAPHNGDVLERFPVVGYLQSAKTGKEPSRRSRR